MKLPPAYTVEPIMARPKTLASAWALNDVTVPDVVTDPRRLRFLPSERGEVAAEIDRRARDDDRAHRAGRVRIPRGDGARRDVERGDVVSDGGLARVILDLGERAADVDGVPADGDRDHAAVRLPGRVRGRRDGRERRRRPDERRTERGGQCDECPPGPHCQSESAPAGARSASSTAPSRAIPSRIASGPQALKASRRAE